MLKLGIIGQPLTHSLSPLLHGELMRLLDLPGEYRKYELPSEDLQGFLADFARAGGRGLNVTIPHKLTVMGMMDSLSPEAELAGAINTIVLESNPVHPDQVRRHGHNTDISGFIRGFPESIRARLAECRLLLLGAGGSARAVIAALMRSGVQAIMLAARNPEKTALLLTQTEQMKAALGSACHVSVMSLDSPELNSGLLLAGCNGVINTTPLGMWPDTENSPLTAAQLKNLPSDAFVYDLIYRPGQTRLLRDTARLGLETISGLDMLLFQGIFAFELWSGVEVPANIIPAVREVLSAALIEKTLDFPVTRET